MYHVKTGIYVILLYCFPRCHYPLHQYVASDFGTLILDPPVTYLSFEDTVDPQVKRLEEWGAVFRYEFDEVLLRVFYAEVLGLL